MKKNFLYLTLFLSILYAQLSSAAGLIDIYNDALKNDQTFKQAEADLLQNKEILPQAFAALLPRVILSGGASKNQVSTTTKITDAPTINQKNQPFLYNYGLTVTQPLFNAGAIYAYGSAKASVAQAAAKFSFAAQDLIIRVANAYFNILQASETVSYAEAQKKALESQLHVSKQRYEVGLDPITSVYQAQAAYDAANTHYIARKNAVLTAQENLRVMTNQSYPSFNSLQYAFETVAPEPTDIDTWARAAVEKNLNLKAARFGMMAAQDLIKARQGNRLPSVDLVAGYNNSESQFVFGNQITTNLTTNALLGVNAQFNAYTGGAASSLVREAKAGYLAASANTELAYRQTVANTRIAYWGVLTGISQIQADRQAIKSSLSALKSIQAGYKVGTQTFTDVLQQMQLLYQVQTTYTEDRFNYLLTTLQLKQAVGTLNVEDLIAIDKWLSETNQNNLMEALETTTQLKATTKIP